MNSLYKWLLANAGFIHKKRYRTPNDAVLDFGMYQRFDVLGAFELSRATLRKMHQNLFWAVAYNVVAFLAAAGVFYPFVVNPVVAALAMSGRSALVAVNAMLLKLTRLESLYSSGCA